MLASSRVRPARSGAILIDGVTHARDNPPAAYQIQQNLLSVRRRCGLALITRPTQSARRDSSLPYSADARGANGHDD